ncbi:hypothetical protein BDB01DRAFT_778839 [Pilobolus umbonatus]|nr:hypothetical protein BDB01DRAFT_778839 [Pilobolus umbonatus]
MLCVIIYMIVVMLPSCNYRNTYCSNRCLTEVGLQLNSILTLIVIDVFLIFVCFSISLEARRGHTANSQCYNWLIAIITPFKKIFIEYLLIEQLLFSRKAISLILASHP